MINGPGPGDELLGDIRTGGEPVQGVVAQGDDLLGQLGVEPDVFDVVDLVARDTGHDRDHSTGIIPVGQGGEPARKQRPESRRVGADGACDVTGFQTCALPISVMRSLGISEPAANLSKELSRRVTIFSVSSVSNRTCLTLSTWSPGIRDTIGTTALASSRSDRGVSMDSISIAV